MPSGVATYFRFSFYVQFSFLIFSQSLNLIIIFFFYFYTCKNHVSFLIHHRNFFPLINSCGSLTICFLITNSLYIIFYVYILFEIKFCSINKIASDNLTSKIFLCTISSSWFNYTSLDISKCI